MTGVSFCPLKWNSGGLRAAFVGRIPGIEGSTDREEALSALESSHREEVARLGFSWEELWRAEQVHGCEVAEVPVKGKTQVIAGVDGLMTGARGVLLGIYVADCAAVYLVDRKTEALALVHAGRKGAEGGIVAHTIRELTRVYGTRSADLEVLISPCIRPPHYEVDFAAFIHAQLSEAGVPPEQITDEGISTAENLERFYSYRLEKGKTGRMLALLGWCVKQKA